MSNSDKNYRGGDSHKEMGSDNGAAAEHLLICCCHDHKRLKIICREGERKKKPVGFVFSFGTTTLSVVERRQTTVIQKGRRHLMQREER